MALTPVLHKTIDTETKYDERDTHAWGVTVLAVDNMCVTVVIDCWNTCIKSFYTRNGQSHYSRLSLNDVPCGITQLKENQVMVTVPELKQIVTVKVTPDLVLLSTISTSDYYFSIAVLSPSSLAAGTCSTTSTSSVDILNMDGQVVKSITHHNNVKFFNKPHFMCVNSMGNILVSDFTEKSVICMTQGGDVVWQYRPLGNMALRYPHGITTTSKGDILFADNTLKKVIQLNDSGEFVRDVLTSADGLTSVCGIVCTESGSIFVCDGKFVKEFKLE